MPAIGFDALLGHVAKITGNKAVVGWYEGAVYPGGIKVSDVAAMNEYGTRTAPARPFMRPAIEKHGQEWKSIMLKAEMGDNALDKIAIKAEGDIVDSIANGDHEPLSPITLAIRKMREDGQTITGASVGKAASMVAKGTAKFSNNTTPLSDTGRMIATLNSTVVTNG
jgi:hypothetical protein